MKRAKGASFSFTPLTDQRYATLDPNQSKLPSRLGCRSRAASPELTLRFQPSAGFPPEKVSTSTHFRVVRRGSQNECCSARLATRAFRQRRDASLSMLQETLFLKVPIGGENDQVDRCCLCLGRRNFCAGHVTRAASSVGQHDYANPPRMRRGYAHDQWQMRDHICPPQRTPRCHPRISRSLRKPAAVISALIL